MNIPFTQAAFEDIYHTHVGMLKELQMKRPNQCHQILSSLFNAVTSVFFFLCHVLVLISNNPISSNSSYQAKDDSSKSYVLEMLMNGDDDEE